MDILSFLNKVLPDVGIYCIATPRADKGFIHHHYDDIPSAAAKAISLSGSGLEAYFALGSFRDESLSRPNSYKPGQMRDVFRVQENVKLLKSFWLDLDVKPSEPDKAYSTQQEALEGLQSFLKEVGLPTPMIVSSGYGVHCYWTLNETVMPHRWKITAEKIKSLCVKLKLKADSSRTSDSASVLRPIGANNYKRGGSAPVSLLLDADALDLKDFERLIDSAAKMHNVKEEIPRGKSTGVNAGLAITSDYQASYPDLVANNCNQIKEFRDKKGSIGEPHWYTSIQLLHFCVDGDTKIHEWSKGHTAYNEAETERKIIQIAQMGPPSCATFKHRNADGCKGCPFEGQISSPIQLGIKIEDKEAEQVSILTELGEVIVEVPPPPTPFRRATTGLFVESDGAPLRFYRYDMFPMGLVWDDADGHMTIATRHHLPREGWQDFRFPAGTLSSQKDFETLLIGQGIIPDSMKYMRAYMSTYIQNLQNTIKMQRLYDSLGWKEDKDFVFGKRIFTEQGIFHAGLSKTVPKSVVDGISSKGDLNKWIDTVSILTKPDMEAHLFAFCAGFGSPLLSITGFNGCLLSMVGASGAGKTLAARMALSIYGKFKDLVSGANDTMNARMERLNAMANLPMFIDEVTNIESKQLSTLVYMLSEGRGREKLRSDSTTRAAASWSAIAMSSSNKSLYNILSQEKDDSEAEMMRVLEIWVPRVKWFEEIATEVFDATEANYGLAGDHYIKYIVANRDEIKNNIKQITDSLVKATGFSGKERFWAALCGCVLFGYVAAFKCGLIKPHDFQESFARLFHWVKNTIISLRSSVATNVVDDLSGVGQYINAFQAGTLVVHEISVGNKTNTAIRKKPVSGLVMRVEEDKNRLYIDRKHLKSYMASKQLNYDRVKKSLKQAGVLVSDDTRKMLGSGTGEFRSMQVPCWVLDLSADAMSGTKEYFGAMNDGE